MIAAQLGDKDAMALLLENHAEIDMTDVVCFLFCDPQLCVMKCVCVAKKGGHSALMMATQKQNVDCVSVLLKWNADVNLRINVSLFCCDRLILFLFCVCVFGVKQYGEQLTPFEWAKRMGFTEIIDLFNKHHPSR